MTIAGNFERDRQRRLGHRDRFVRGELLARDYRYAWRSEIETLRADSTAADSAVLSRMREKSYAAFRIFALLRLAWISPCDISIILLASQINERSALASRKYCAQLKVIFYVRGVISPASQ